MNMRYSQFLIYIVLSYALSGCFLVEKKQKEIQGFISETERMAPKSSGRNEAKELFDKLSSVNGSHIYKEELKDPFRIRRFVLKKEEKKVKQRALVGCKDKKKCLNAPKPHEEMFLERYAIDVLSLVGVLGYARDVALIRTPDAGTHMLKKGEYIGKDDGKVVSITENSVVVQEKVFVNGKWKNKKTILVLR